MPKAIADLLQPATKGDRLAIKALMDLGDSHLKEGDLKSAAQAFKEAAISYRIDAFRQKANYEEEHAQSRWRLEIVEQIFVRWLEAHPDSVPRKRPEILDIPWERLIEMFRTNELEGVSTAIDYLYQTLTSMGFEFYSPGGSVLRRIVELLRAFGGAEVGWAEQFLNDVRVRIALDQLTDRVLEASKEGNG
ncbi:MAG: hypothetical protein FJY54_17275 [Betaproteobacteria bacterium]|nr:hypothetical protein [Betaproteobacteria bacterium]